MAWTSLDSVPARLLARFGLIGVSALVAVLLDADPAQLLVVCGYLGVIAVLASVPTPRSIPAWTLPLAECLAAVVVIISQRPTGTLFLPYLVAPVTAGALLGGLWPGVGAAALASVAFVSTSVGFDEGVTPQQSAGALAWVPVLVSLAILAAAVRRLRASQARQAMLGDPAYMDAHRVLTELQRISRHLSLGLDPRTLGEVLLEETRSVFPSQRAAVVLRTEAGVLVPLAGNPLDDDTAAVVDGAWWAGAPLEERRRDDLVVALPVLSGGRVLAAVCLVSPVQQQTGPDGDRMRELNRIVGRAAPRLASALLFDQVRRLATVDERNRMAREIHDGIAQDLASLGYLVDDIASDADPTTAERLGDLGDRVRTLVQELRLRIFDLRTEVNDSLGLGAAITEYVQRVAVDAGLTVQVTLDEGGRRLPMTVEIELLRIVQEAVQNVRKHARATTVAVHVSVEPPAAHITIMDDGRGLQSARADSVGIRGMRERASRIGARLTIRPMGDDRSGTVVEIDLQGTPWSRTGPDTGPIPVVTPVADEPGGREKVSP